MVPFSQDAFLALFADYNRAIWPAQIVAYGIGLFSLALVARPGKVGDRLLAAGLAAFWLWMGVVYHMVFFATINGAAWLFAALFVVEGLLLAWFGVARGRLAFRWRADLSAMIALTFIVYAMAIYPAFAWFVGHGWPRMPIFGVAPCPTTIFTLGMFMLAAGRVPVSLLIVPVLWSFVGGSAAWLLDMTEDLVLPAAGVAACVIVVLRNRRRVAAT